MNLPRITLDDTLEALAAAKAGEFEPQPGEPNAAKFEKKKS